MAGGAIGPWPPAVAPPLEQQLFSSFAPSAASQGSPGPDPRETEPTLMSQDTQHRLQGPLSDTTLGPISCDHGCRSEGVWEEQGLLKQVQCSLQESGCELLRRDTGGAGTTKMDLAQPFLLGRALLNSLSDWRVCPHNHSRGGWVEPGVLHS